MNIEVMPPHKLSGGQKQRVAIAGVIAMMPRCIVFDEPTAMLDPAGRKEVMRVICELNETFWYNCYTYNSPYGRSY